jgi:hypothetical protein
MATEENNQGPGQQPGATEEQAQHAEGTLTIQKSIDTLIANIPRACEALRGIYSSTEHQSLEEKRTAFNQAKDAFNVSIKQANDLLTTHERLLKQNGYQTNRAREVIYHAETSVSTFEKRLFNQEQRAAFKHLEQAMQVLCEATDENKLPSEQIETFQKQSIELRRLESHYSHLLIDETGEAKLVDIENTLQVLFAKLIDQHIAAETSALQAARDAIDSLITNTKPALQENEAVTAARKQEITDALEAARLQKEACANRIEAFRKMQLALEVMQTEARTQLKLSQAKLTAATPKEKEAAATVQNMGQRPAPATTKDDDPKAWFKRFFESKTALFIIQGFGVGGLLGAGVGLVLLGAAVMPPIGIAAGAILGCIIAGGILLGVGCLVTAAAIYLAQKWRRQHPFKSWGKVNAWIAKKEVLPEAQAASQQAQQAAQVAQKEIENFQSHETAIAEKIATVAAQLRAAEDALEQVNNLSVTLHSKVESLLQKQATHEQPTTASSAPQTTATLLGALLPSKNSSAAVTSEAGSAAVNPSQTASATATNPLAIQLYTGNPFIGRTVRLTTSIPTAGPLLPSGLGAFLSQPQIEALRQQYEAEKEDAQRKPPSQLALTY